MVIGLLLVSFGSALAEDVPFTLVGELDISGDSPALVYKVGPQAFLVNLEAPDATACYDGNGASMSCNDLTDGSYVEVMGNVVGTTYTATAITQLSTAMGVLKTITGDIWTVGDVQYKVSAELALGFAVGDLVTVTYKNVAGTLVAVDVEAVNTSTFVGKVIAMGGTWQVNGEYFTVGDTAIYADAKVKDIVEVTYYGENMAVAIALYPTTTVNATATQVDPWMIEGIDGLTTNEWTDDYEGAVPGDIVTVVYYEYEGVIIASEITLYAPIKNENSRCEDWRQKISRSHQVSKNSCPRMSIQPRCMPCSARALAGARSSLRLSFPAVNPEDLWHKKQRALDGAR